MSLAVQLITLAAAVGCALAGGALFSFSAFVLRALDRLPAAQAIAAMQSINREAITPAFMTALFGPAPVCAGLGVWAVTRWGDDGAAWALAAAALYLVGVVGVTMAANVPRNNALDRLQPDAAARWSEFYRGWIAWNHVRVTAAIAAAALLANAVRVG